jgi:hypothetical protein
MSLTFEHVMRCWYRGDSSTRRNDSTDGSIVYFHGNPIIRSDASGHMHISTAGWGDAPTTRARLNKAMSGIYASKSNHDIFLNEAPWYYESKWLDITMFGKYYKCLNDYLVLLRDIRNGDNVLLEENWKEYGLRERNTLYIALLYILGDHHSGGSPEHPAWTGTLNLIRRPNISDFRAFPRDAIPTKRRMRR